MSNWIRNPQLGYAKRIVTLLDGKAWEVDYLVFRDEKYTTHPDGTPVRSRAARGWANRHRWRLTARVTMDSLGEGHPDKHTYLMRKDDSEGYRTMADAQAHAEWIAMHGFHHVALMGWVPNGEGHWSDRAARDRLGLSIECVACGLPAARCGCGYGFDGRKRVSSP